jgi:hypothetical protein
MIRVFQALLKMLSFELAKNMNILSVLQCFFFRLAYIFKEDVSCLIYGLKKNHKMYAS